MKYVVITMTPDSTGYYHPSTQEEYDKRIVNTVEKQDYKLIEEYESINKEVEYKIAVLGKKDD